MFLGPDLLRFATKPDTNLHLELQITGLKGHNMHLGLEGKVVLVTGKRLSNTNSTRQNTTLIAVTLQEAQKASAARS